MEEYIARVREIFESNWITNGGQMLYEFEERIAKLAGTRHCVATANGTLALQLAIRAVGLTGEVIVPSFTFVATPHALLWQGLSPVFADIGDDHNLDPASVERAITPRTSGIIGVHLWGRPCAVAALTELAERHRLTLLFDAAHAVGCSHGGRPIGSFGAAEIFSFHGTKYLTTGEGGAVVTNDDTLAARMRELRNFGFAAWDTVTALGVNGKMSELNAALGLAALDQRDQVVRVNRSNLDDYISALDGLDGVRFVLPDDRDASNFQYVVAEIGPEAKLTRNELLWVLTSEGVLARRYFFPGCHRMEPYRALDPDSDRRLPRTLALAERVLVLPTGCSLDPEAIQVLARIVRTALANPEAVREGLKTFENPYEARSPAL